MTTLSRRSFLVGVGSAAIVAPALMKFELIRPKWGLVRIEPYDEFLVTNASNTYLSLQKITKELLKQINRTTMIAPGHGFQIGDIIQVRKQNL